MIASLLVLLTAAASPTTTHYAMHLAGVPVGDVELTLEPRAEGGELRYASETRVRRGPVVTRDRANARLTLGPGLSVLGLAATREEGGVRVASVEARGDGEAIVVRRTMGGGAPVSERLRGPVFPSALAPRLVDGALRRCVPVIEETSGRIGEACGASRDGRVEGSVLGERFVAVLAGDRMIRLEFPEQQVVFVAGARSEWRATPPDLFANGVVASGPEADGRAESVTLRLQGRGPPPVHASASQQSVPFRHGVEIRWQRAEPAGTEPLGAARRLGGELDHVAREVLGSIDERWQAAQVLARAVDERVEDKQPGSGERSAEHVYRERRASCVGHTELFLALAARVGLPARRAVGLVLADGRWWRHAWPQVLVRGRWYDVEPTEGEAPARAPRVALAAGDAAAEVAAGQQLGAATFLRLEIVP